jgi:hypothetical protein
VRASRSEPSFGASGLTTSPQRLLRSAEETEGEKKQVRRANNALGNDNLVIFPQPSTGSVSGCAAEKGALKFAGEVDSHGYGSA